jgi:hypothetical protein
VTFYRCVAYTIVSKTILSPRHASEATPSLTPARSSASYSTLLSVSLHTIAAADLLSIVVDHAAVLRAAAAAAGDALSLSSLLLTLKGLGGLQVAVMYLGISAVRPLITSCSSAR